MLNSSSEGSTILRAIRPHVDARAVASSLAPISIVLDGLLREHHSPTSWQRLQELSFVTVPPKVRDASACEAAVAPVTSVDRPVLELDQDTSISVPLSKLPTEVRSFRGYKEPPAVLLPIHERPLVLFTPRPDESSFPLRDSVDHRTLEPLPVLPCECSIPMWLAVLPVSNKTLSVGPSEDAETHRLAVLIRAFQPCPVLHDVEAIAFGGPPPSYSRLQTCSFPAL
mmetsp:Transcript_31140/g.99940  ORF Transcript_31140/g.99940 Transcript_31140/m.99940 type:complete len:226 (+) Transcript_31140:468-1145(+)